MSIFCCSANEEVYWWCGQVYVILRKFHMIFWSQVLLYWVVKIDFRNMFNYDSKPPKSDLIFKKNSKMTHLRDTILVWLLNGRLNNMVSVLRYYMIWFDGFYFLLIHVLNNLFIVYFDVAITILMFLLFSCKHVSLLAYY